MKVKCSYTYLNWSVYLQLKEKADDEEMRILIKSHKSELTDANTHELMDETRQLLERIEFKDHSTPFLNKVY